MIAFLSGMRDEEVRELGRDCAFTEPADDGRVRYKLRGRVYKGARLSGEEADWVVLEVVHQAVDVLLQLNDVAGPDHQDEPETDPEADPARTPARAGAPGVPWAFNTRQFRRSLAWHIAHQPFGIVAGAKQYKHARHVMFSGYAGTSASGFAAEEAVARLDYAEDLYRDWNDGGALTVANLCAEARVSRASYYRSPVAAVVKTLLASDQTPRPEVEQLRQRARELDKAGKEQRRHAQEVRDLKAAAAVYANQVQVLALRNGGLEVDNRRLVGNWRRWKRQ